MNQQSNYPLHLDALTRAAERERSAVQSATCAYPPPDSEHAAAPDS